MAVPVARVHLKVAHAALPALLPTPPVWNKLPPLLSTPPPCAAAFLAKAKPSRADADERWDARKTKPGSGTASSASSSPARSAAVSSAGRGSCRKNATSPPPPPPPKPGRADCAERWDAHKKAATARPSSAVSRSSSSKCASSAERWDVHKIIKRCSPALQAELPVPDDGESNSTRSNDADTEDEEEEEIVWKPRAMYAGPGFAAAVPEPGMLPLPTAFLVPAA